MEKTKTIRMPNEILFRETARLIDEGRSVVHTVRGNSMNPFLVDRRDKVTLSSFRETELKRGALVVARDTNGRIVLHRIIARQGDALTLMGDGSTIATEQTSVDEVMALTTKVTRKGKTYSCQGAIWRAYSYWWMLLLPVRRYLLSAWRRM